MTDGFFNFLKPAGPSSSDAVVQIRRLVGGKTGHLGTLDPGAAGVLPIAVGKGTKLFDFLAFKTKKYRAFFTFGTSTDTLDSYGKITEKSELIPAPAQIESVLPELTGEISQIPPQYSAKSVDGVRAYEAARKGGYTELKTRAVTVNEFIFLRQADEKTFVFDITCGGGTYIRSLARDLASKLGTVAYMSALVRLASGDFKIENSVTKDELIKDWQSRLLPLDYPLGGIDALEIDSKFYDKLKNGAKISCESFGGLRKIYCKNEFFGLGLSKANQIVLEYNLHV